MTPVALFIFNRPHETSLTFSAIRSARPDRLFIIADGPRHGIAQDQIDCLAARAVVEKIDWPCEVTRSYAETNIGVARGVAQGIDMVFRHVEAAVILEDDCVPHSSFFPFCSEMLDRYRYDERIMMISGCNFQNGNSRGDASYYFSAIWSPWGWATWRRAWKQFDFSRPNKHDLLDTGWLRAVTTRRRMLRYWTRCMRLTNEGRIPSWDFQWFYTIARNQGLCIKPQTNLIKNVGFNDRATNTTNTKIFDFAVTGGVTFPLVHPHVVRDKLADDFEIDFLHYRFISRWPIDLVAPLIDRVRPYLGRSRAWSFARKAILRVLPN